MYFLRRFLTVAVNSVTSRLARLVDVTMASCARFFLSLISRFIFPVFPWNHLFTLIQLVMLFQHDRSWFIFAIDSIC